MMRVQLFAFSCAAALVITACAARSFAAGSEGIPDPAWLHDKLQEVCKKYKLPALAAAVVEHGKITAASVVGVRKLGGTEAATRDDRFHLGSITKPMTATLLGLYIDEKLLGLDTTLEEMFPELVDSMKPAYRKVTVRQLMSHTSGMPYQPHTSESVTDSQAKDPAGRRYEYVKAAVIDEPDVAPGTKPVYSGGGIIVASYLERKTGTPYEQLITERVFKKLGMDRAGFGSMASEGKEDGPWEHAWRQKDGKFVPVAPRDSQRQQARSPVGRNVFCSVTDLARFAAVHLDGAKGRSNFLAPETFKQLRTGVPSAKDHGPGWLVNAKSWAGGETIWHNGSTGVNYAVCTIGIERDFAACVMTNAGGGPSTKACDEVQFFIGEHLKQPHP